MCRLSQIFLSISCLIAACTSAEKQMEEIPDGTIQIYQFRVEDMKLEDCGLEGSLSMRLRSCADRNPAYSRSRDDQGRSIWQLVSLQEDPFFRVWLDVDAKILWSHVLEESGSPSCSSLPAIANGERDLAWNLPAVQDYRSAFEHTLPADLMEQDAELFMTRATEDTGEVVDEWKRIFLLAPKDQAIFYRCTAI